MCTQQRKTKKEFGVGTRDPSSFQLPEVRKKMLKSPYSYIWFSLCSQKYRRKIKDLVPFFWGVYCLICPNLPRDGMIAIFFYMFLWMIATLATNNNSPKKHSMGPQYLSHKFRIKKGHWDPFFFYFLVVLKDCICTTLTT